MGFPFSCTVCCPRITAEKVEAIARVQGLHGGSPGSVMRRPRCRSRRRESRRTRSISFHTPGATLFRSPAKSEIRAGGRSCRRTTSLKVSPARRCLRSSSYVSASRAIVFAAIDVCHTASGYICCVEPKQGVITPSGFACSIGRSGMHQIRRSGSLGNRTATVAESNPG